MFTSNALRAEWLKLIDERCDRFELAWQQGERPELEAHLADLPQGTEAILLRELVVIELNHRKDESGQPVSTDTLLDLHPQLRKQIAAVLEGLALRDGTYRVNDGVTAPQLPSPKVPYTPGRHSRGLRIRCPHCHNRVELLADTPFEDVTCSACGSTFNLVKRDVPTRLAESLQKMGRFELISRLGLGGFGTVWKARDTELDRVVAVKIPRKGQLEEKEVEQFFREARAAAQLKHPNIVPVHEVGCEGDTIFVVTDFVRGVSLSDWLTGQQPTDRETAELCATIADALHHAHEHGVIHRDLKPPNIMIDDDGEPHIMDFGLAKREIGEITVTVDGQILGTPAYMSPEQAKGHSHWTDRRTDIYSLGVVIFQLLSGELPFRGNAQMQIHQVINEDPPNPRKLNGHVPQDMATICLKCLEKDPNKRYATAKDLADELRRFLRGEPIRARPVSAVSKAWRWSKRNPALATAVSLMAISAVTSALLFWRSESRRKELIEVVAQKQKLVLKVDREVEHAVAEQKRLTAQLNEQGARLAAWEGGADPSVFWPPYKTPPPFKQLIEIIVEKSALDIRNLPNLAHGDEEEACVHYALALLFEELSRNEEATQHYRMAKELLQRLTEREPSPNRYAWALAECCLRFASLRREDDHDDYASLLKESLAAHERLAPYYGDIRLLAHRLVCEQRLLVTRGYSSDSDSLTRMMRLSRDVKASIEPFKFYRLACYLSQQQPLLTDSLLIEGN